MDGFLFGACCRLPADVDAGNVTSDHQSSNGGSSNAVKTTAAPTAASSVDSEKSTVESTSHSSDTVYSALIHKLKLPNFDSYMSTVAPITLPSPPPKLPPLSNKPFHTPSIILGNGTVVSLESMSLRPLTGNKVSLPVILYAFCWHCMFKWLLTH